MDKHLFQLAGVKKNMFIIGLLTVVQSISVIFQALFLSSAITSLFKGTAYTAVLPSLILFGVFLFLRYFLQWTKERISYRFAEETSLQYQNLLIEKLFSLGPRTIGKHGTGSVVTLCLEGVKNYRTYLELFIPRSVSMVCIPLILLVYIFMKDVLSGVVLFITMPIMLVFLILLGLLAQKKIDARMETYQMLSRHFVDSLRGIVTLKFLGKSKAHEKAIESVSEKYRIATNSTLRLAFLSTFALDFFSSLSVAVVAVELGLRLIDGKIGLELALMVLILAPEYFLPIRSFGNDYHATMDGKEAGERIRALLNQKAPKRNVDGQPLPLWDQNCTLSIEGLTKNAEGVPILKDVTFQVKGYMKVGVVGHSGAGKSTLIDILAGLSHEDEGKIFYNGRASSSTAKDWLSQLTYIPQNPYIFSGTVADNISWYAPNASIKEIWDAVRRAGLMELVDTLPNGLHERIGQGGRALSGGEEQRMALARSLLQQRPIMLFDEPTAHLDIETEHDIKQLILPYLTNKLVFFATHRLHWMKEMDVILVLEEGQLVEVGSHEELYQKNGSYFRLIQALRREGT